MIALVELLPTILAAVWSVLQAAGVGYLAWKLESRGAADKVIDAVGSTAGAVGSTAQGVSQLPSGALAIGVLVFGGALLLRR